MSTPLQHAVNAGRTTRGLGVAALCLAFVVTLAMPAPAASPEVVVDDTFTTGPEVHAVLSDLCGFEIMVQGTESVRVTIFSDRAGDFKEAKIHARGEFRYWTDTAEAFERFAVSVTDSADGTRSVSGNVWNVHAASGQRLIHDSGRVLFDGPNILSVNGPHEELLAEFGVDTSGIEDFCDYMRS